VTHASVVRRSPKMTLSRPACWYKPPPLEMTWPSAARTITREGNCWWAVCSGILNTTTLLTVREKMLRAGLPCPAKNSSVTVDRRVRHDGDKDRPPGPVALTDAAPERVAQVRDSRRAAFIHAAHPTVVSERDRREAKTFLLLGLQTLYREFLRMGA